ncbi:hypothetical protein [Pseudonocardia alni]|uniref:hypothetical protein n=1 Tax=Pseudonocardia alni TaxID=33907 RepID=UPI00331F2F28
MAAAPGAVGQRLTLDRDARTVLALALSADGNLLVAGDRLGRVTVWDRAAGFDVVVTPDGRQAVSGSSGEIWTWSLG